MTDIEIGQAVYDRIKGSALASAANGELTLYPRADNSGKEDICISVLSSRAGQIQQAFVSVNIYVQDVTRTDAAHKGQKIANRPRLRTLCGLAWEILERFNGGEYRFTLDEQRVLDAGNGKEHIINNKILLTISNE